MNLQVSLKLKGTKDVLEFSIDKKYEVDLNSEACQNDLKNVFCAIVSKLIKNKEEPIQLAFAVEKGYEKKLFIEVCEEYINSIESEIEQVRQTLLAEKLI